jgi:hypothetical protein
MGWGETKREGDRKTEKVKETEAETGKKVTKRHRENKTERKRE